MTPRDFFVLKDLSAKRADGCQSGVLQHKNMSETGDCKGEDKEINFYEK